MAGNKPAARLTDWHSCPLTPIPPHVGGPVAGPGAPTVLICGLPAARVSDMAVCIGPPDTIIKGSATVLISGMPAARMGDITAHGGVITVGAPTVLIGEGGASGGKAEGPEFEFELELGFKIGILEDVAKWFNKLELKIKWLHAKAAAFTFGDKDTYIKFFTAEAEVETAIGYNVVEKKYELTPIKASAGVALAEEQLKGKTAKGMLEGKVGAVVGKVKAEGELGLEVGEHEARAAAKVGVEATAVEVSAEQSVRITGKTIYDNTWGRLKGTEAPKSWDYGIKVGAKEDVGIGAAAKAGAKISARPGELEAEAEAAVGFGPKAGAKVSFGIVWPEPAAAEGGQLESGEP